MNYTAKYELEKLRAHVRNMKLSDTVISGTQDHWNAYNMAISDVIFSIDKRIGLIKKKLGAKNVRRERTKVIY